MTKRGKIYRKIILNILRKLKKASAYDVAKERWENPSKDDILVQETLQKIGKTRTTQARIKKIFRMPYQVYAMTVFYMEMLEKEGKIKFIGERDSAAPLKKKIYQIIE
ncbi:MAG: hypothetical protein ACTSUF_05375 [Candidatus Heimdallarchaeaceae archaeon]